MCKGLRKPLRKFIFNLNPTNKILTNNNYI